MQQLLNGDVLLRLNFIKMNNKIKTNSKTVKTFNYSKGPITLSFSLTIDTKEQLEDFLELLIAAKEEIELELKK